MEGISTGYWAAVAGATVFSFLLTWQAFEHRRYARSRSRHDPKVEHQRPTCLFVPCKGLDDDLEENLQPLFEQDLPNYEICFIVESQADPAANAIRRAIERNPQVPARLVVAGLSTDSGQKVHNLLVATEHIPRHIETLVFVDADVHPPRDWLRRLTGRLHSIPVSTGYRCFVPKRATFANFALSAVNSAVVPIMFPGKHHLIWGGSWAITRELFESSNLREAWRGTLSDDLIATRVMAQIGQRVGAEPTCILPSPLETSVAGMLSFVRRQLIIGRCYVPVHWYALLLGGGLMQGLFWGSLLAAIGGLLLGAAWAWQPLVAVSVLYALHLLRAHWRHAAARYYLRDGGRQMRAAHQFDLWLGPLAGLLGWLGIVASAFSRRIIWKGIAYQMRPGGAIASITRPKNTSAPASSSPPGEMRRAA